MMLFDTLAQGLLLGGLYALFAAGLSLVFGIMRLVNLAHGDLIILGAYLILTSPRRPDCTRSWRCFWPRP
jgi:branched-chain amino acid transport system permease protein